MENPIHSVVLTKEQCKLMVLDIKNNPADHKKWESAVKLINDSWQKAGLTSDNWFYWDFFVQINEYHFAHCDRHSNLIKQKWYKGLFPKKKS